MATKVTLRSTDVSAYVVEDSLQYGPLELGNRIGSASCQLRTTSPVTPEDEDYFEITDTDGVTRLFSGVVRMPAQAKSPAVEGRYVVRAQGWGAVLKRTLITAAEAYAAGKSDVEIVSDLLTKYYGPVATSVSHVLYSANPNMPALSFAARTTSLFDALETISRAAYNAVWYVDPDKKVRWNDVNRLAPFALSDVADGTYAKRLRTIQIVGDGTATAARVRVVGSGGAEYTATDWVKVARLNLRNADQPGAAALAYYDLPDITDAALTTTDQCKQRAWAELAALERRTILRASAVASGLVPGMRIDLIASDIGNRTTIGVKTAPHPQPRQRQVAFSSSAQLHKGIGRFTVQRVTPRALDLDQWELDLDAGTYEPQLDTALARVGA